MISVYIHIPFCNRICTYCDFCKLLKVDAWVNDYLVSLEKEIKSLYRGEEVKTLYIGGGSPSCLNIEQLKKLFDVLSIFKFTSNCEITFEANSGDLTLEKLLFLKDKVNRLSIGIETFNKKYLKLMGRDLNVLNIKAAKKYFDNINIDLMYNFDLQNTLELKEDLKKILELDVPHISAYSLIIEPHTKLFIECYKETTDDKMDRFVSDVLKRNGYNHYEISNYCKKGYESKHNLVYWDNDNYYGFGLGASGYIDNVRYDNTRNIKEYLKGKYLREKHTLDLNETLQNEFILGFRKLAGINKKKFYEKYGFDIHKITVLNNLISDKMICENKDSVYINPDYLYVSNEILLKFFDEDLLKH